MKGSDIMALRRRAMDLLARREHSRLELERKLRERFPAADEESMQVVLARLAGENLQSDRRFAEELLRSRMRRGFGWLRIRADLQACGVDDAMIAAFALPDAEWIALAAKLVSSRLDEKGEISPGSRDHQRLFRFLLGRGFPAEIVRESLRERIRISS